MRVCRVNLFAIAAALVSSRSNENDYIVRNLQVSTIWYGSTINTLAGTGGLGYSGDGGPATAAAMSELLFVAVDALGSVLTTHGLYRDAGTNDGRVRNISSGKIYSMAGFGVGGSTRDGGLAINASLNTPSGIACSSLGTVFIADYGSNLVHRIDSGVISTYAGGGILSYDGVAATTMSLNRPIGLYYDDASNSLLIVNSYEHTVRIVYNNLSIGTLAGVRNMQGYSGDFGPSQHALLNFPSAVTRLGDQYFISDWLNHRVRMVSRNGTISTVAGSGVVPPVYAVSHNGGPATSASLNMPYGLVARGTQLFIADSWNHVVRVLHLNDKTIHLVAGTGVPGFGGDFGLATSALLNVPTGLDFLPNDAGLIIADRGNSRLRLVAPFFPSPLATTSCSPTQAPMVVAAATCSNNCILLIALLLVSLISLLCFACWFYRQRRRRANMSKYSTAASIDGLTAIQPKAGATHWRVHSSVPLENSAICNEKQEIGASLKVENPLYSLPLMATAMSTAQSVSTLSILSNPSELSVAGSSTTPKSIPLITMLSDGTRKETKDSSYQPAARRKLLSSNSTRPAEEEDNVVVVATRVLTVHSTSKRPSEAPKQATKIDWASFSNRVPPSVFVYQGSMRVDVPTAWEEVERRGVMSRAAWEAEMRRQFPSQFVVRSDHNC